jgi:hypothetical protein
MKMTKGNFFLEVINEDGTVAQEVKLDNSLKTELLNEFKRISEYNNIDINLGYIENGTNRLVRNGNNYHLPVGVALLNDVSATSTTGYVIDEGDLVGYFDLLSSNSDSSDLVRGNRLTSGITQGIDVDGKHVYTAVGEFGTAQMNTTFNKIGFIADHWGYDNIVARLAMESKTSPCYLGMNEGVTTNRVTAAAKHHGERISSIDALSQILSSDTDLGFPYNINPTVNTPFSKMSTARTRVNMTCSANGEFFTLGAACAEYNTANIEIFHVNKPPTGLFTDLVSYTPILSEAPGVLFKMDDVPMTICYDHLNKILYFVKAVVGDMFLTIWPLTDTGSGWTKGVSFQLATNVAVNPSQGYMSAAMNATCTEINVVYNEVDQLMTRVKATINSTSATEISITSATVGYSTFPLRLTDVAVIDDDILFLGGYKSGDLLDIKDNIRGSNNFDAGNGRNVWYVDFTNNKQSYASGVNSNYPSVWGNATGQDDPYYTYNTGSSNMGNINRGSYTEAVSYGLGHVSIDSLTKDYNYIFSDNVITGQKVYIKKLHYTPLSASGLISSATFPEITKVGGQSIKVTYKLTTDR